MEINKKFFICFLMVLMLFICVNAASASDTLDTNLTSEDTADTLSVDAVNSTQDKLSSSGDTYVVDQNGGGQYTTISEAVSAATGGETIFIKNGEYTESTKMSLTKSLNFVGESRDGVIIKSSASDTANYGMFDSSQNGVVLSFKNLNFKDIHGGNVGVINVGGDSNLDIIDCTFDGCHSKYGTMWIKTTGTVNIEGCEILNSQAKTSSKGATAIYFQGNGSYNIKDTVIDNAQYTYSAQFAYAALYIANNAAIATLDNVTISNCGGNTYAIIYSNGQTTVRNSRLINNSVPGATGNAILRSGKELNVEQSIISNNTAKDYLIYCNNGIATLNYNNIAGNTVPTSIYGYGGNTYSINADSNYWGSNELPSNLGTTVNNYVIQNDNGEYTLNNGDALEKDIPGLTDEGGDEPQPVAYDVYVSQDGDDGNDGSSAENAVRTIEHACEIAPEGGSIYIFNGTYLLESPSNIGDMGIEFEKSLSLVGEDANGVSINFENGAMIYVLDNMIGLSFDNIAFEYAANGVRSVLWAPDGINELNITNCIFRGIQTEMAMILLEGDSGKLNINRNLFEALSTEAILHVNANEINANNNIFLSDGINIVLEGNPTVNIDYNYFGSNDKPVIGNLAPDYWVIATTTVNPTGTVEPNDEVTITVDFNQYTDGTTNTSQTNLIPDRLEVRFSAEGNLSDEKVLMKNGVATTTYSSDIERTDKVHIKIENTEIASVNINVVEPYKGIIYVNATGSSDDNEGSIDAPVATIGKAIELALVDGGSHEIIINEGTYVGNGYHVTGNLTVTGNGKVTLDANNEGRFFYMDYRDTADKIELSNLILTNSNGYGAAVYSFANELILDNVTIVNTQASGYLIKSNAKLTIRNSKITRSMSGDVIQQSGTGDVLINNTVFENNVANEGNSVYSVIDLTSGSGNLLVENSKFINNTVKQSVIRGMSSHNINVKESEFIDNTNDWNGGAIYAYIYGGTLDVTDSKFINNKAGRDGGAIDIGWKTTATIDKSVFINNSVTGNGYYGDAIHNDNVLTITNSVLLTNSNKYLIYNEGDVASAQNNWWGTNSTPKNLVASGYDEDEEDYYPDVDVSNWVTMDAGFDPVDAQAGEGVIVTATFSNANLPDGIPVTFGSTSGLNTVVSTVGAQASINYTIDANDEAITATSGNAVIEMPISQATTNIVTQDNFYSFFDDSGMLLDTVPFDELIFQGDFSDLVQYITIDRPITITGEDAVLNDIAFIIAGNDITLDNLTMVANSYLGNLIDIAGENVVISNNNITYVVNKAANAINVYGGANGVQILNNSIYFESTVDEYTVDDVTNAICVNSGVSIFDDKDPIEGLVIDGNNITAVIPAFLADIYENEYYVMGISAVNGVRINGAEDFKFKNNKLDVTTNRLDRTTPTYQAIYVASSSGLIDSNNIIMIDTFTPAGKDVYIDAMILVYDEDLTISNNNFNISTTGGKEEAGSAYAIVAIASDFSIVGNNVTTVSNGPNLAVYFPSNMGAPCDVVIAGNFFNVTGLASSAHDTGLVSGVEVQTGDVLITGNTIYTYSIGDYAEGNYLFGISYAQDGVNSEFEITDNIIFTEGHYAISLKSANDAVITDNYLVSADLAGDDAVYIKSGSGNTVKDNKPTFIVTNDTFYDFFDESGLLRDDVPFNELVFEGEFSDLAAGYVVITKPISIVGNDAVLNNMGIVVSAGDVTLEDLTFIADSALGDLVYVGGSNVELNNLNITYIVDDEAARAISIIGASDVTVNNANIFFESHVTDSGVDACAINIEESENVVVTGSEINSSLPALYVNYDAATTMFMGLDQVNPIRIMGSNEVYITKNIINSRTNAYDQEYATIQAILVVNTNDCLIDSNEITLTDEYAQKDQDIYLYGISFAYDKGLVMSNNNFTVYTEGGKEAAGTAYAIQGIESELSIIGNSITTFSNGPNLGIYVTSMAGEGSVMLIEDNFINVTGLAASGNPWALVSGIEIQNGDAKVYNNTIYTYNVDEYDEADYLSGISYIQYMYGGRTFNIQDNYVWTEGKYPIYLIDASNSIITGNTLYGHELTGDDAVYIQSGDNNLVKDNMPPFACEIVIDADMVFIGNDATINVSVVSSLNASGKVTIVVNGKEFKDLALVDGKASQVVGAADLVAGINDVTAIFTSDDALVKSGSANSTFTVLDGVVTQDTYMYYFNQEDGGKFFDYVPEGATLDFQGSIINPDQNIKIWFNVNKPVNIITSTNDAYIDLNTTAGSLMGENPGNRFTVSYGGSGSNITGINFHNTQLWIFNTHHVVLDNISNVIEDQRVGSGVGATSVRANSTYVTVKNSYFYTRNNGGSSSLVMAWADYCTFDNNLIVVEGNVGNMIYLTTFNVEVPSGVIANVHNRITNNRIYSPNNAQAICWALVLSGSNNLVENNTIEYKGVGITTQYGSSASPNNTYVNNHLYNGSSMTVLPNSILYNNYVSGALTVDTNGIAYNNTVDGKVTVKGANAVFENNTVAGAVTISGAGVTFVGNDVSNTVTVNSNNNVIKQNTITSTGNYAVDLKTKSNNVVTDNVLYSNGRYGDNAVSYKAANNNTVKDNHPPFDLDVVIEVGNTWYGTDNIAYVTVINSTGALGTGSVTFKINGKSFTVDLIEGKANCTLPGEAIVAGENELVVDYVSDSYLYKDNSNSTTFIGLDGVVTNATYEYYFDASGNLASIVPDGATLDFQGLFLGKYPVYINKAVNVISSTEDALFDCGASYAGNAINSFNMIAGADHSNITGLKFINYCLYIKGASYITVDGVSIVANKRGVGSGTGFLSIHTGAYYTIVKNGYFENGGTGSSLLVLGKGGAYVVFDHNIFNITGSSGNILSANQFVGSGDAPEHVSYTNNVLYNNQPGSAFCYAMTVSGSGNLVENNTIYHNGSGILNQYGASSTGNVYRNNTLYGNTNFNPSANSIVENNKIYATTNIAANTIVSGNTFTTVAISGTGTKFTNNTVAGTVTVKGNNNELKENNIASTGDYAIDLGSYTGNTVEENELIASSLTGDAAVNGNVNNNIIKNNYPNENGLSVSVEDIMVGDTAVVNVSIYSSATGTVKVIIDGKVYDVPIDDGSAILELSDLKANDYDVRVIYDGDKYVTAGENFTSFTVSKYKSDAIITTSDIAVRTDVDVNVAIANATGDVTVIVDGNTLVLPLNDGVATFTIPSITAGEHTIRVSYLGDDNVEMVSNSTTFTVDRMPTSINVSSCEIYVGQTAEVTISFSEMIDADVLVEIDGKKSYVQLTSGTKTLSYGTLTAGTHDISVTFAADDYFDSSSATGQIIVNKMDAGLNADASDVDAGSDAIINVEIDAWAIGDVNIIINGQSIPVTFTNGKASVHIPGLTEGNYTALVKFEGDDRFNADETNVTFKVSKVKIDDINVDASVVKGTTDTQFKITLPFDATGTVTVTIGDKSVDDTLTNGKVAIAINDVTPGSYNVTVSYTGDDKYTAAEKTVPMTVDKLDAGLKATTDDIYVGEDAIISITINRAVTGNVNVYLGNLIVPVTINNGRGSAVISDLSNGTYTATVRFANDDKFADDEKEVTFTVYKYDLDTLNVVVDVPQETLDPEFSVTLPSDATGTITVTIDGKNATGTLTNGEVTVTVSDVTPGFYDDAIVSYSGDNKYEALQETVLVIVDKLDAGLEASADDIKVGENATISIEINEDVTGDVRIEFGNEVIPVTIVDGEASVEIPGLPEGTYTALVKFIGDSIFDEDEIEVIFTVSKEDSSSEANLTIDIPEGTTSPEITIEMPSDATGNLTVIIDDETYTSELVNGTATVKVPELVPGTYDDVVVAYTGDDKYSPMFNTTSIVVPKLDAGLKATSNDISLGEDAIISIEIDSRATGTVSVFIGDAVIPVTLDNGKADVSVPGLGLGNHTAVVKFEGDILFNASEVDVNISVSKDEIPENSTEPSMDIPDETTAPEFTINLPEDATGNFTVTVDGENYTAEVVNGTATVKVPDLTVGNHTISTAYSGDDKYDGYTTPAKPVDIPKAKISGGDSALDPKTPAGSSSPSYSINLPSDATGNLTVTVDGVNHTQALVNGSATVILHNLTEGNHNITVAYTGDAKYSNISKTSVYNVKVPVVKITNNKDVTMLYSAKTPYKVLVTVDGKAVGAGETVSMTFNGVTYKVQTDRNGYATLNLPDVKPKNAKYTITAEYKGVKVSNKVKVNSIVKAKNVKVKKSKKVNKIKVTLKKVNGKFLKGKKITLKIKGKKITAKTNKKGVATFKVKKNVLKKLKVGKKYKYTVTYGKDVVTKKLTVKK